MVCNQKICRYPFTDIEINRYGDVACCGALGIQLIYFGNIFENSFEEIWNGEKAQKIREEVIKGSYGYCNYDVCRGVEENWYLDREKVSLKMPYPEVLHIGLDPSCDCKCIICRNKILKISKEELAKLEGMIDSTFIPMLKNAKLMQINSEGEVFVSEFDKKLIKESAEKYPNLRYEINTNGIYCTEENLRKLGIIDRIERICVTVNAATKETYKKMTGTDEETFEKVINNLFALKKLKSEKKIKGFSLTFCVTPINFRELPDFIKLCNKLKVCGEITEFKNWDEEINLCKNFDENDIFNPKHPNHEELVEILQLPVFNSKYCQMNDYIRSIQEEY